MAQTSISSTSFNEVWTKNFGGLYSRSQCYDVIAHRKTHRLTETLALPANNELIKFKMSRLYEEYNKNQLLFTMSQIALFLVNTI